MTTATADKIETMILDRQAFKQSSVSAKHDTAYCKECEEVKPLYIVNSYNTAILKICEFGHIQFNNTRYSNTTSRLQNLIKRSQLIGV